MGALLIVVGEVVHLVARCRIYAILYRRPVSDQ
jgi:hypothetical protein